MSVARSEIIQLLWLIVVVSLFGTVYPYVFYPLILRMLPARLHRTLELRSDGGIEFALLFCAYNERSAMSGKIRNLRRLRAAYPRLEVLAYDDCSTDGTADLLESAGIDITVIRGKERAGKAHGMKLLASLTEREFLVFTDANVEVAVGTFDQLRTDFSDPNIGGICGHLEYFDDDDTPATRTGGLYWRIEELIKTLESRSGNVMGADGSIFSTRRNLYPSFPDSVLDDLTVSMAVVTRGFQLIKDERVVARERLVGSQRDDLRRRIRIATRAFHTHMWLRPQLKSLAIRDRWRYWSHRVLRWYGGFFIVSGYSAFALALFLSGDSPAILIITAAAACLAALGIALGRGPLSSITHVVLSILLTTLGVLRAYRGRTVTTWKPPTR